MSIGTVDAATITEYFDSDPGWRSFNLPVDNNDFGFRNSNFASGNTGEAGGFFSRSDEMAWYGDDTVGNFTGNEILSASGLMNIYNVEPDYNNNIHIGHFDRNGPSQINGIGFQILEYPVNNQTINPTSFRIFYEIGSYEGLLFTITGIKESRTWSYLYDPNDGSYGSLTVSISGSGGDTATVFLSESQRNSIGTLNVFGLAVGDLVSAPEQCEFYIDNVSYTSDEVVPEPELVGHWSFNENTGSTVYDRSGYGNNGEITGATWAEGACGDALSFDGGLDGGIDYVVVPNSQSINTSTFTVSFWVSISDLDETMIFLHKRNGQWWRNFQLSYNANDDRPTGEPKDYLKVKIDNGTLSNDFDNAAYAEVNLEIDRYYYVVGTYDQNKLKLYLDGIKIAEHSISMTDNVGGGDLYIGTHGAQHLTMNPTQGVIDEVRIYDHGPIWTPDMSSQIWGLLSLGT
jgi:hypothetical protein